jgi:hypothetical protein
VRSEPSWLFFEAAYQDLNGTWHNKQLHAKHRADFSGIHQLTPREIVLEYREQPSVQFLMLNEATVQRLTGWASKQDSKEIWKPAAPEKSTEHRKQVNNPSPDSTDVPPPVSQKHASPNLIVILKNGEPTIKE